MFVGTIVVVVVVVSVVPGCSSPFWYQCCLPLVVFVVVAGTDVVVDVPCSLPGVIVGVVVVVVVVVVRSRQVVVVVQLVVFPLGTMHVQMQVQTLDR